MTKNFRPASQANVTAASWLESRAFVEWEWARFVGAMTGHKVVRVALYSRVSTKDKGQDVRNQTDQLREFCERQKWQIVREFMDKAFGTRGDRVRFKTMFEPASRHEFDAVLFWSLDRAHS
jgi:predicted site-specific integrase-resolvase